MISIIVPIYNAEKQLERLLKSIQNQTFLNFEVIMIDDGSIDHSADVCKWFVKKDLRFQYFYQENKGVSVARNNGLKRAKGDYITFVDADDEIDQNYLDELINACQNSDIAICDVVVECNGNEIKRFTDDDKIISKEESLNLLLKREVINSGPYAKLFKNNIIAQCEFPVMKTYEDILFNLYVFSNATRVAITSKTQYHYIENHQGAMSMMSKSPSVDIIDASECIMYFIKKNKDTLDPECIYVTISHLFQYVLLMVNAKCKMDKSFINKSIAFYKKFSREILSCRAIPMKEKIVFISYIFGWVYSNKQWRYVKCKG